MPIDPITNVDRLVRAIQPGSVDKAGPTASSLDSFGQVLDDALSKLSQKELAANQAIASLAAGEDVELHQVMLAMQEADIAFQLATQVRNKLVEAYQEVMRMQV